MKLTQEEQKMLDGAYGEGVQLAMKVLVAVGEAYDAPYMVPVTRTHVALSNQEADLWFVEKLVRGGAHCKVSPTVNPGFNIELFEKLTGEMTAEDIEQMQRTRAAYQAIGATLTYSCTPYLQQNIPFFAEITAYSESSATPYVNSVYGARSNREAAQSALCAAVTGVTPYYGYLIKENRRGQALVEVKADMHDDFAYQMLGYVVPEKIGFQIPVFEGLSRPTPEALMNLGAELNTAGNVAIYHILGVTPEAQTYEDAFQGQKPTQVVTVTDDDLAEMQERLSDPKGKIDFALYGCPHFSIRQIHDVVQLVKGQKLAVPLYIMCSTATKDLAEKMGFLEILHAAGGELTDQTCMDQPCWRFLYGKKGVTDSPKCAYYTKRRQMQFVVTSLEKSVEAALKGEIA